MVLVIFDELPTNALLGPSGQIDRHRYPWFAALARRSTWFPNAQSVSDSTLKSVPAILDGRLPRRGLKPTLESHPRNLFTLFARLGYRENVDEPSTTLCPVSVCGPVDPFKFFSKLLGDRVRAFRKTIRAVRRTRRPTFTFAHVLLPHGPTNYLPSGRRYAPPAREPARCHFLTYPVGFHDRFLTDSNHQRNLLQVGFTDRLLGQLLRHLRRTGLLDRSLIVVTSDHGVSWQLHTRDRRKVTRRNINEVAPVPLFIKAPHQRHGRVNRAFARTIDIAPTVARLVHARLGWRVHGKFAFGHAVRHRHKLLMLSRAFTRVTLGARSFHRRLRATLRRKARTFGVGSWRRIFRIGPHPELLGRTVAKRHPRPRGSVSAVFTASGDLRSVNLRSHFIPALVTGWLQGVSPSATRGIALALNGRIVALGRSFHLASEPTECFTMMLPERSFRSGSNSAKVFQIGGRHSSPTLTYLGRG